MTANPSRCLVSGCLLASLAFGAGAQTGRPECRVDDAALDFFLEREAIISRYEQLSERCLKDVFLDCSAAARETILDGHSAALCSMGYEALLRRSFRGDFNSLMAWWRSERSAR